MAHFRKGSPEAKAYMAKIRGMARRPKNPLDRDESRRALGDWRGSLRAAGNLKKAGVYETAQRVIGNVEGRADVVEKFGFQFSGREAMNAARTTNPGELFALDTRSTGPGFCDKCESEIEDARLTALGWACPECGASLGKISPEHFVEPGRAAKAIGKRRGNPLNSKEATEIRGYAASHEKSAREDEGAGNDVSAAWEHGYSGALHGVVSKYGHREANPSALFAIQDERDPSKFLTVVISGGRTAPAWAHASKAYTFDSFEEAEDVASDAYSVAGMKGRVIEWRDSNPPMLILGNPGASSHRTINPLSQSEAERILEMSMHRGDLIRHLPEGSDGRKRYSGIQSGYAEVLTEMAPDRVRRKAILAHERKYGRESQISGRASSIRTINPPAWAESVHRRFPHSTDAQKILRQIHSGKSVEEAIRYVAGPRGSGVHLLTEPEILKEAEWIEFQKRGPNPLTRKEAGAALWESRHYAQLGRASRASGDEESAVGHGAYARGAADVVAKFGPKSMKRGAFLARQEALLAGSGVPRSFLIKYPQLSRRGNPSSSAVKIRRGNPSAKMLPARIANDPAFKREVAAYTRRHGCPPARVSVVNSPAGSPKYASAWGHAPEVKYDPASDASNKGPRVHKFGEDGGTKPYLVSSVEKGSRYLGLLGGTFRAGGEWILR